MSLAAPVQLVIAGENYPVTRRVYAASGSPDRLKFTTAGIQGTRLLAELQVED